MDAERITSGREACRFHAFILLPNRRQRTKEKVRCVAYLRYYKGWPILRRDERPHAGIFASLHEVFLEELNQFRTANPFNGNPGSSGKARFRGGQTQSPSTG